MHLCPTFHVIFQPCSMTEVSDKLCPEIGNMEEKKNPAKDVMQSH